MKRGTSEDVRDRVPETLQQALERAAAWRESRHITWVRGPDGDSRTSFADLHHHAGRAAGWLRTRGVGPGDKVLLTLSRNDEFVRSFWACLFAGAVPVPLPSMGRGARPGPVLERLRNVCRILRNPFVILDGTIAPDALSVPSEALLTVPSIDELPGSAVAHEARPDDVALIQFSSGSTGTPKGVVLTHRNILANLEAIRKGAGVTPNDVGVNWMPLHHDLGLIGFLLGSIFCPSDLVLIETSAFVRRPLLWLDTLETYGGTITAAPNFGQALVLPRLGDQVRDLSRVRVIFNGGEPISVDVMQAFMAALLQQGLRPEAMFPVYGLAEAAVAVSFSTPHERPLVSHFDRTRLHPGTPVALVQSIDPNATAVVAEGRAVEGCEIRVVDDEDRPLDHSVAGHIQVRGTNVTSGYYEDPAATEAAFCDQWLRTGDLGVIHDGVLYVTGRAKDVLFVHGQNLHATDIEAVARGVSGMERRRVAACGLREPGEAADRLILFVSSGDWERDAAMFRSIHERLREVLGITADAIVPLPSSAFPRTTSGKTQRFRLREGWEQGEYRAEAARVAAMIASPGRATVPPRTPVEIEVHTIWARELGLDPGEFGVDDPFDQLGGTSLSAVAILASLEERFRISLDLETFGANPTVASIATVIGARRSHRLPGRSKKAFTG